MKKYLAIYLCFFSIFLYSQNQEWVYLPKCYMITCFAEEGNDIWIGSYSGIVKMNKTTGLKTYYNKATCPLPDNNIICMSIGENGVKWFGTQFGGLAKYDGENWSVYDTTNSPFPDNAIAEIVVDSSNNLWVIGQIINSGLLKFDGSKWTRFTTSNSNIPSNLIGSLHTKGNTLWFFISKGLVKFDGTNFKVFDLNNTNAPDSSIIAVDLDSEGKIWLLHSSGVEKFDGVNFSFYGYNNTYIPNTHVTSMSIDNHDIIWASCESYYGSSGYNLGGIMSFNGKSWTKYDSTNTIIPDENVLRIYADQSNNIWAGCKSGLVYKNDGNSWQSINPSKVLIDDAGIQAIVFDKSNNAYIRNGRRLIRYDGQNSQILNYSNYHSFNIATDNNGNLFVKSTTELKKYDGTNWTDIAGAPLYDIGMPFDYLNQLVIDSLGGLWIDKYTFTSGSHNYPIFHPGIAHYDGHSWITFNSENSNIPDSTQFALKADSKNNIWIGTPRGLTKYDGKNWKFCDSSNLKVLSTHFKSIAIDHESNVWIPNGYFGFVKFDGTHWINYNNPTMNDYSSWGEILEADNDGTIWQTYGYAYLFGFDGFNWTTFTTDNSPIPAENITSLSIDKFGNKWIGTTAGILIFKKGGVILNINSPITAQNVTVKAFPNPFKGFFEIQLNEHYKIAELTICDIMSRVRFVKKYEDVETIKVLRNNMVSGIYFYQLKLNNSIYQSGKIIAQ
jgi:ligand-binding sensor domain-containing protein